MSLPTRYERILTRNKLYREARDKLEVALGLRRPIIPLYMKSEYNKGRAASKVAAYLAVVWRDGHN